MSDEPRSGLDRIYSIWDQYGRVEISPDVDLGSDLWHIKRFDLEENNKSVLRAEITITDDQIPHWIEALTEIMRKK